MVRQLLHAVALELLGKVSNLRLELLVRLHQLSNEAVNRVRADGSRRLRSLLGFVALTCRLVLLNAG